jgi:hypothetical protein
MDNPTQESTDREIQLLLVEDSEIDAELTMRFLKAAGFKTRFRRVADQKAMRRASKASR